MTAGLHSLGTARAEHITPSKVPMCSPMTREFLTWAFSQCFAMENHRFLKTYTKAKVWEPGRFENFGSSHNHSVLQRCHVLSVVLAVHFDVTWIEGFVAWCSLEAHACIRVQLNN